MGLQVECGQRTMGMTTVRLYCQQGEHYWLRPSSRGRTPFNCPEHQPAPAPKRVREPKPEQPQGPRIQHLHCKLGDHDWERPWQPGRAPFNCPDHRPVPKSPRPKSEGRVVTAQILQETAHYHKGCTCGELGLHEGMSIPELQKLGAGCTEGRWVCPRLDAVRRRIGAWD